jgi:hypothetical protein
MMRKQMKAYCPAGFEDNVSFKGGKRQSRLCI